MEKLKKDNESIMYLAGTSINSNNQNNSVLLNAISNGLNNQQQPTIIHENPNIILPSFPIEDINIFLLLNQDLSNDIYFDQLVIIFFFFLLNFPVQCSNIKRTYIFLDITAT